MCSFGYDRIGYWSEAKLEIIRKYATAYTTILTQKAAIRKCIYIDAFAGAGTHISRDTGEYIPGSPLNALNVEPHFSEFYFIDMDCEKTSELRKQTGSRKDVFIYEGDANQLLIEKVFPRCLYKNYHRALCLLDPYSLSVDWNVLQKAGRMGSIEIFYNFMIMDANMNVLWHNPDKVDPLQAERLDKVWGDRSWRNIAYSKQTDLFGDQKEMKFGNEAIAEGFRKRLKEVAGFKYVPKPVLMRNEKGATIYYLFFASPNNTGAEIVEDIFEKYRTRGIA